MFRKCKNKLHKQGIFKEQVYPELITSISNSINIQLLYLSHAYWITFVSYLTDLRLGTVSNSFKYMTLNTALDM